MRNGTRRNGSRSVRLLRSATLRLTIIYLLTFAVLAAVLLGFIYRQSAAFMRAQTDETIAAEITGLREQFEQRGLAGLQVVIDQRIRSADRDRESIYLLSDWSGNRIAGNLSAWPTTVHGPDGNHYFSIPTRKGQTVRAVARTFAVENVTRLLVGRSIEERLRLEESLRAQILQGAGFMLLIAVIVGFLIARWTTGRLEAVNRAAREIMAGDLGRRIGVHGGGDEFDELAENLNAMLTRIERLVVGMREVTDNIAHDLRTPLSRMRMRLELALAENPEDPRTRELIATTIADAEGLIGTFNALLGIARANAGERRAEWETLDLSTLLADVFELFEPLAEERGIDLVAEYGESVEVNGNRQLLAQVMANLVDNAIKYTQEGGRVEMSCGLQPGRDPAPFFRVRDNGPGIAAELREKALERFSRLEPERSTPGNGLGLSLVQAVARLHDAELRLEDASNGTPPGLSVTVMFPPPTRTPKQA
ncbi:MAG: HAMP domain-containing protein [Geminicoccaceae bacterium]|nr:HAMP domain-containing protein [Geminicoccaceae bacterium]